MTISTDTPQETATETLFQSHYLARTTTQHLPKLTNDYLEVDRKLEGKYQHVPKPVNFKQAIARKQQHSIDRKGLREVLKTQYEALGPIKPAVGTNLDLLIRHNTFTITTGHQLCLFTGPLYFIYKLVSAVVVAKELSNFYPGHHFVPVYWMATEDHDFAEINHLHLPGKTLTWEREAGNFVGEMSPEGLDSVLQELADWMGDRPQAEEVIDVLRNCYLETKNLAQATAKLVDHLFGRYGLLVIDPNDRRLKANFLEVMRNDLAVGDAETLVGKTAEALEQDYKVPVHPRAVNLFYHHEGQRLRIDPVENREKFQLAGTDIQFTRQEILQELEQHPERFSPNVVLRPLYQEAILPNLAYIGGGSEVAYWLELKSTFDHFNIPYPVVIVRNSGALVPGFVAKKMQKIGVEVHDFFQPVDQLLSGYVKGESDGLLSTKPEQEALKHLFTTLSDRVSKVDPTLVKAVEGELQRSINGLAQLENKLVKAEKRNQETTIRQLQSLHQRFFPEGKLQERYDNFLPHYLQWGDRFIEALVLHFQPFDTRMTVLVEKL